MRKPLLVLFAALTNYLFSLEPVIVLVGPPGSGKGTFSQHLKECYHYNHISSGDIVRREIARGTSLGLEIEEIVRRGDLIPNSTMHALIASEIKNLSSDGKPLIIDGFGRAEESFIFLHTLLSELGLLDVTLGIFIEADDSVCAERISHRQICSGCGHIYNTETALAKILNTCDLCHAALAQRLNDTPAVISKRIREYRERVAETQMKGIEAYPHFTFLANRPVNECLEYYSQFAEQVAQFNGNAKSLTLN